MEFIYLVDPKGRISQDTVQDIIDFELSKLDAIECSSLLTEIDNAYLTSSLDDIIPCKLLPNLNLASEKVKRQIQSEKHLAQVL